MESCDVGNHFCWVARYAVAAGASPGSRKPSRRDQVRRIRRPNDRPFRRVKNCILGCRLGLRRRRTSLTSSYLFDRCQLLRWFVSGCEEKRKKGRALAGSCEALHPLGPAKQGQTCHGSVAAQLMRPLRERAEMKYLRHWKYLAQSPFTRDDLRGESRSKGALGIGGSQAKRE